MSRQRIRGRAARNCASASDCRRSPRDCCAETTITTKPIPPPPHDHTMTPPADMLATNVPPSESRRFRVHDNARALWTVMAVLLMSGFAVLRLLTGASDAPQVDTANSSETVQPAPPSEMPTDDVHRLRPQTSSTLPHVEHFELGEIDRRPRRWLAQPACCELANRAARGSWRYGQRQGRSGPTTRATALARSAQMA